MNPFILVTCFYVQMCNTCTRSLLIEANKSNEKYNAYYQSS